MKNQPGHPRRKYPLVGACGLDCGLCPRFNGSGASRCPGCCGERFWEVHPSCGFVTCCVKEHGFEACGECKETDSCPRVLRNIEASRTSDSFLSYKTLAGNLEFIKKNGTQALAERLQERMALLRLLMENFDDGRSKGFYCLAVQLLPLEDLNTALAGARKRIPKGASPKERAQTVRAGFNELAERTGVELKLRTAKSSK